jgi:hypothetical protein
MYDALLILSQDAPTLKKEKVPVAWNKLCPIYNALTPDQL